MFESEIVELGAVRLPKFTGLRVMMMPFHVHNPMGTIPWAPWGRIVHELLSRRADPGEGTGYVTIDEATLRAGETHRRPGLHVDGIGEDGKAGAWGGGGGYASNGMIVASNRAGCVGWRQSFHGFPGLDGNCEHLRDQLQDAAGFTLTGNRAYWCGPLAVHASTPMRDACRRQFLRISMPSDAPWHEGYTPSPFGILPGGPILPRRLGMTYRPAP